LPASKIGRNTEGPSVQKEAPAASRLPWVVAKPPTASRPMVGKKAARATPIWALAAEVRRSPAATWGRRGRSSEAAATGIGGAAGKALASGARLKLEAGWPTRLAMACS